MGNKGCYVIKFHTNLELYEAALDIRANPQDKRAKKKKNSTFERQNSGRLSDKFLTHLSDISNSEWTFERQVYPF